MAGSVGHRRPGATDARALVPRQRRPSTESALPVPRAGGSDTIGRPSEDLVVLLVADPLIDSRRRLATELTNRGGHRVIEADTVAAVQAVIDEAEGGSLALVSLGFGVAAPRLIEGLRQVPWTRVIAVAPTPASAPVLAAVAAGATGILRGRPAARDVELPERVGSLTAREVEILRLVADGRSNKWIADDLSLSALTVKSHLARISRKLGTGDRSHQVAVAFRVGLLR